MRFTTRVLADADAEEYAALAAAIEAHHPTNFQLSAEDFLEIRNLAGAVVEGAFENNRMVAWSGHLARAPQAGGQGFLLAGDVHPGHAGRGLGTLMCQRALTAARAVHQQVAPQVPATYAYRVASGRADAEGVLDAAGFRRDRFRINMVADLADLSDASAGSSASALPEGYDLVEFDPADGDLLRLAHNAAFDGYPNHHPADAPLWQGFMVEARHVRHRLSFWARHRGSGAVAAYLFSHEHDAPISGRDGVREMYIPYLGTVPGHRRLGLAMDLLEHALAAYRDAGYDTASLEVDTANPTGALGLYERAGFVTTQRFEEWLLTDPAAGAARRQ